MAPTATPSAAPSAEDLRAALGRANLPRYRIAALIPLNPSDLGAVLNGRRPLTPELAARIASAIAECAAQTGGAR